MKRFTTSALLALALSIPVLAGDIPGSGKSDPPPTPTPIPTNPIAAPTSTTDDTTTLREILLTIYLALKGV